MNAEHRGLISLLPVSIAVVALAFPVHGWSQQAQTAAQTPPASSTGAASPTQSAGGQQGGGQVAARGKESEKEVDIEKLPWNLPRKPLPWEERFRVHRSLAVPVGEGRVRVGPFGGPVMNVLSEEGDFLIIQMAPPEDPSSPFHKAWLWQQTEEARKVGTAQMLVNRFFVADKPDVIPAFVNNRETFVGWGYGLPLGGEWQLSGDVADFDADGRLDLVVAPPRGGRGAPTIYLNRGNGQWEPWAAQKYPTDAPLDYGSVRVGELNGDGHLDLALACHFRGYFVLFGNGAGDFTRWQRVPTLVAGVTSKVLDLVDVNGDRRLDLLSLAEVDLNMADRLRISKGLVEVVLNLPDGWKPVDGGFGERLMGDSQSVADLDGDGFPDLIIAGHVQGQDRLFYLNRDRGLRWDVFALDQVPFNAFVTGVAAGPLGKKDKRNVAVLCFEQVNPEGGQSVTGCALYRFWSPKGEFLYKPSVEPLFTERGEFLRYQAVALGDVDGDGNTDIVVGSTKGKLRVFLQLSPGRFFENTPAIEVPGKVVYARVVDMDGDKRGEILAQGVPFSGQVRGGGVWIFKAAPKGKAGSSRP